MEGLVGLLILGMILGFGIALTEAVAAKSKTLEAKWERSEIIRAQHWLEHWAKRNQLFDGNYRVVESSGVFPFIFEEVKRAGVDSKSKLINFEGQTLTVVHGGSINEIAN